MNRSLLEDYYSVFFAVFADLGSLALGVVASDAPEPFELPFECPFE